MSEKASNKDEETNEDGKSQVASDYDAPVKSEAVVSAQVGTSNKSSGSFRNINVLARISEDELLSGKFEGSDNRRKKRDRKKSIKESNEESDDRKNSKISDQQNDSYRQQDQGNQPKLSNQQEQPTDPTQNNGASVKSFGSEINQLNDRASSDYDIDDLNFNLGTMTIEQDHDDEDETNEKHKLKRTVMTILLTQRWRKSWKKAHKRGKKGGKKIVYLPTYRLEPKQNIHYIKYLIANKARVTFESLIDKHKNYDTEYTPRFLRILAEMIKNDAKSYKLDRYKIISHISILQKSPGQSIQFISKLLGNHEHDSSLCLKYDTKSFYAICLLFFVYYE